MVKLLGKDCINFDFKAAADALKEKKKKKTLLFKIMENKEFFIRGNWQNFPVVCTEPNFRNFMNKYHMVTNREALCFFADSNQGICCIEYWQEREH